MISQARTNIFGNIIRTVHSGISAGDIRPAAFIAASASLARSAERTNSALWISSASMPWTCRCASMLVERAIAKPSAIMNSAFARFLVENWCMTCGIAPVRLNNPLHISGSRWMKTRSHGTRTSSNTASPSPSSRREESG